MSQRKLRRPVAGAALTTLVVGALVLPSSPALAAVPPGFEGDVGVFTNGADDVMDIGDPTYNAALLEQVQAALEPGVPFTAGSMHESIFDKDLAAGGTDYYLDRILGVSGTSGNNVLQTRGRTLYMRGNSTWNTMGFAGSAHAGGSTNLGNLYTVTVPGQTLSEVGAQRFNAPSHAKATYNVGSTGVQAKMKKFITYDNVAVTTVTFENSGESDVALTVRAASPIANAAAEAEDELIGTRAVGNTGGNMPANSWTTATVGLKAKGFSRSGTNLDRAITVPAGGSVEVQVTGVLYTDALPESKDAFYEYADKTPAEAFRDGVTEFNRRWAQDIPYIDVPDPALEKAIVYRWWGERYNSLDANEPGYVYQYPVTIEGVNLYQNAIVLTQPMHLQDTKWIRNPYLAYGQILNLGELSGSSAFLDSPGHSSWNNHYSQYMGTAGLEAFNVHGGGAELAERFAHYFEWDGKGQLEHYDGDGNKLIQYTANYMPGNDADAISFGYPKSGGGQGIERPESAYVWGSFDAARQLYELAGAPEDKVEEMAETADEIRDAILDKLWNDEMKMFLARTTQGAQAATSSGGNANPLSDRGFIPARESNLYDVYAQNLIPFEDAEDYKDGFRFLRYGDNFPIFPFYTANQYDRSRYSIGGSNNFSNINFTVQYRGVRSALRHYDPDHEYVTPEYAARLLDWMAWSIYPSGNVLAPNQAEYYSNWNSTTKTFNRNNPNHIMLGNMNYIFIEDMGGIQPRSDEKIELWPIDLGYEHFMVNNLRYHGKDVTIVWDPDGSEYGLGAGYMLFLDGEKVLTADALGRLVFDPVANEVVEKDVDLSVTLGDEAPGLPAAVDTPIEDERVVSYLKTAGIDLEFPAANLAEGKEVTTSATQSGQRPTPWRDFHTVGRTGAMNYHPGAIAVNERPVSAEAVTDGVTVNEPYWGNYGTEGDSGWVEIDLGGEKSFDNVKVFFVQDPLTTGHSYVAPQRWVVELPDGDGGWAPIEDQFRSPKIPGAKLNEALFETVTADKVRVSFTNAPGKYTAISEIQVFDSGRDVPPVVNEAPVVSVQVDSTRQGNLTTGLLATVTDDGIPVTGSLTYGWEVVSAPEGGAVIFSAPGQVSTTVTGTVAGTYVLRFWAEDGELRTDRELTVELTERAVSAEYGAMATITTSGSASWENPQRVKEPTTPSSSNPGAGHGWGTWGQAQSGTSVGTAAWIQYTWDSPVILNSSDIYWYDDNGGTRRPRVDTYAIEFSTDGSTWTPVTLSGDSTYAGGLQTNRFNHFDFEAVEAKALRIRVWGVQSGGAGTGVLRWRANGATVDQVLDTPVLVRTGVGEIPTLPAQLPVRYSSGHYGEIDLVWQDITADQVAETNTDPFVVYGVNAAYGKTVEARVYVRPEMSAGGITISSITPITQSVEVGEQPYLPSKVAVFYNDGSWDNQAHEVEWDYDPSVVDTPGTYTILGDVSVPWYVGATEAKAVLTLAVGEEVPRGDIVSVAPVTISTEIGTAPELPSQVLATFENGDTETLPVTWAAIDPSQYASVGTFTVVGDVDGPGGEGMALATVTVTTWTTPDTTAPTVAATVDPASASTQWLSGSATVSVVAWDDRDSAPEIEIDLGEGWVDYAGPVVLTADGEHIVLARATDESGNVSTVASVLVKIDATAPVSRATVDEEARTVSVTAADETSGVETIEVKVGAGAWTEYTGPVTVGPEATTVQHRATDLAGNVEAPLTAVVPKAGVELVATSVAAVVSPQTSAYGQTVKVSAQVAAASGTPSGEVELRLGATRIARKALSGGKVEFTVKDLAVTAGRSFTVAYLGSATHAASSDQVTFRVTKAASSVKASKSRVSTKTSSRAKVSVTVRGAHGGKAPAGRVEARAGKTLLAKGRLDAKGKVTLKLKALKVGTHKVKVTYVGGTNHKASSSTVTVKVAKGKPSVKVTVPSSVKASQRAKLRVTLGKIGVKASGSVVARLGGKVLAKAKVNAKGKATLTLPRLTAGKHKVTIRYQGSKQYKAAQKTVRLTVKR